MCTYCCQVALQFAQNPTDMSSVEDPSSPPSLSRSNSKLTLQQTPRATGGTGGTGGGAGGKGGGAGGTGGEGGAGGCVVTMSSPSMLDSNSGEPALSGRHWAGSQAEPELSGRHWAGSQASLYRRPSTVRATAAAATRRLSNIFDEELKQRLSTERSQGGSGFCSCCEIDICWYNCSCKTKNDLSKMFDVKRDHMPRVSAQSSALYNCSRSALKKILSSIIV